MNALALRLIFATLLVSSLARAQGSDVETKGPQIQVRGTVELDMEREITIGDIAEFHGFRDEEIGELRSIRLGDAPDKGEARLFTNTGLSQIFRVHLPRIQANKNEKILLSIPLQVVVKRRVFKLEAKDVEVELQKQLKAICSVCEFELSQLSIPITSSTLSPGTGWKLNLRPELPKGSFSAPLEVSGPEGRRSYWVTGQIRIYRTVPVAKRAIGPGERVLPNDFAFERKDVTFQTDAFPQESEFADAVAARAIAADQLVGRSMIRREQALKTGQTVKVITGSDEWQIIIDGVAQQSGFVGDLVRVKIPRTQKIISGLLKEKGVVEVQ